MKGPFGRAPAPREFQAEAGSRPGLGTLRLPSLSGSPQPEDRWALFLGPAGSEAEDASLGPCPPVLGRLPFRTEGGGDQRPREGDRRPGGRFGRRPLQRPGAGGEPRFGTRRVGKEGS